MVDGSLRTQTGYILDRTPCEELKRDIELIDLERDIGLVDSYLKREVRFVGSRLGVDVVYSQE